MEKPQMKLRPATTEDAQILYDWRNDEITRRMSVSSDPVEWASHVKWLSSRLARPDPGLHIAETHCPVGTVRIDGDEISYTVAPEHRGKGVATEMLTLARDAFGQKVAKIKSDNPASIAVATKSGFLVELIPDHE